MALYEKPCLKTSYRSSVEDANISIDVEKYDLALNEKVNEQIQKSAKEIEKILKED